MRRVSGNKDDGEAQMEGGRLIERPVEGPESIEHAPEESVGRRAIKCKAKRNQKEGTNGDDLCCDQSLGMLVKLSARPAHEKRQTVEEVYRPIRHDCPGQKRNALLPVEDNRRDVGAMACDPNSQSITRIEERAQREQIPARGAQVPPLA